MEVLFFQFFYIFLLHLVLFKYFYLQNYDSYKKYQNRFEIYIKFCFRRMYFYKKVEIDFFFIYSDFGQGESTLIGYVDLGDVEVNYATLENTEEIASHVLPFLIRGIINPFKFLLANFATTNISAVQLFSFFWKAVGILEKKCFLRVIVATCDNQ